MSKPLFNEESLSDGETNFGTNKEYAKSFNTFRQKELFKKLKDKEGDNDSNSSSDSDSSEDDEIALNPKFDEEFYKALASLKQKDPKIYDKDVKFFDGKIVDEIAAGSSSKKTKALTVKKYEQDILLKKGGLYDDDDDDDDVGDNGNAKRPQSPSYNEEQKMIKNELKKVLASDESDGDDNNDWGGIFKKREKSKTEQEKENEQHKKWLAESATNTEKNLKEFWSNTKLTKDEVFLRDYILSNGYAERDDVEIPTYDEIVGEEDDFESQQTEFEHKYNFRFEEPDQEFMKRYPRTIEHSVRQIDNRRKEKRVEVRERKDREKQEKFKEIEMLKEMKRKEIEDKIEKLKAVTGTDDLNIDDMDLDGDFDPTEYDKKMQNIFNQEYYQVDEGEEKPECPSDIEDLKVENYDEYEPENDDDDMHCEDDNFNMNCEYDEAPTTQQQRKSLQEELIESTRDKRKRRKRKSKFMEMLETKRPAFNPEDEKSYSEYLDEYYKLDCEDIIGDVKCRFKYIETVPCDFGLSVEEILLAKNKELNAWASLKKATQIRPEHVERNEQMMFQRKARNEALKKKILCSLYEEPSDEEPEVENVQNPTVTLQKDEVLDEKQLTEGDQQQLDRKMNKKKKNKKNKKPVDQLIPIQASNLNMVNSLDTKEQDKSKEISEPTKLKTKTNVKEAAGSKQIKKNMKAAIASNQSQEKSAKDVSAANVKGKPTMNETKVKAEKIDKNKAIAKFNEKHNKSLKNVLKRSIDKSHVKKSNGLSDERLKAFGFNPKKFHKKLIYGTNASSNVQQTQKASSTANSNGSKINKNNNNKKNFTPANKSSLPSNKKLKVLAFKNKLKKALNVSK